MDALWPPPARLCTVVDNAARPDRASVLSGRSCGILGIARAGRDLLPPARIGVIHNPQPLLPLLKNLN